MVEEYLGYFTRLSKNKPKTRFFVLDTNNDRIHYVKDSSVLRSLASEHSSLNQIIEHLPQAKSIELTHFQLGPKQMGSFAVFPKSLTYKDLTVFPLEKDCIDSLYHHFSELKAKNSEGVGEEIRENIYTVELGNGRVFCGELNEKGEPHSDSGREFCEDGSIYYGSFRDGKWHGVGCIINSNLDMEQAEFIDGDKCGI